MNTNIPIGHFAQVFTPDFVLTEFVVDGLGIKESEKIVEIGGEPIPVYTNSQRYLLFKRDGLKCVRCNRVADVCYLAQPQKNSKIKRGHFNFFSREPNGKFILFTKDHRVAKAKGGRDVMGNYVPMCQVCNSKKGSTSNNADIADAIKNGTAVDMSAAMVFDVKIPKKVQESNMAMSSIMNAVAMMDASITHVADSVFNVVATRNPKFVDRTLRVIVTQMHNIISCKLNSHSAIK